MSVIPISNDDFAQKIAAVSAGDVLLLAPDDYCKPMVFNGVSGTADHPIVIKTDACRGRAVFRSECTEPVARERANRAAAQRENSGYFPSVGHLGEQARLILRNCQFVIVDGLTFEDCWPSGVFIDNSMYIGIHNCRFLGGTIAIVAQGSNCHDVVVQHCFWKQDTSDEHRMWNSVLWDRIHGAANNSSLGGVDIKRDYRHWDGDFFRAWNVQSNFVFRHNHIEDAFNGIHFFNSRDFLAPGVIADSLKFNRGRQASVNVLIEHNTFVRVRDNVFEPEDHAWNWVIRHNRLHDCYRPFSFEFERAGWFYVYANTGAFLDRPTGRDVEAHDQHIAESERRRTPSLFKCKGQQRNEGPIYVFNNSWYFGVGKGVWPKGQLGRLVHRNNAVQFKRDDVCRFFGKNGARPSASPFDLASEISDEGARFTRRWCSYEIEMDADISNDAHFPDHYRTVGYAIGAAAIFANPDFCKIGSGVEEHNFSPRAADAIGRAIAMTLELPNPHQPPIAIAAGGNRGAVQQPEYYDRLDAAFSFIPLLDWLPALSRSDDATPFT